MLLIALSLLLINSLAHGVQQCIVSSTSPELNLVHPLLQDEYQRRVYVALFSDWIHKYQQSFDSNEIFFERLQVFIDNDQFIRSINQRNLTYQLGHNAFSHLTYEEWRGAMHFGWVIHLNHMMKAHIFRKSKNQKLILEVTSL